MNGVSNRVRPMVVAVVLALVAALVAPRDAVAYQTHANIIGSAHFTGTHGNNVSHVWIGIRAPHGVEGDNARGRITSGGQFHNFCGDGVCQKAGVRQQCLQGQALEAADYALDINGPPGYTVRLNADYFGFGSGYTDAVNNNKPFTIRAKVICEGHFDGGVEGCRYQKIGIYATWTGVNFGQLYSDKIIGYMWFGHLEQFSHSPGEWIEPAEVRDNPWSTQEGQDDINYIDGEPIGVIDNVAGCGGGGHAHLQFYSVHNYGREREWHSNIFSPSIGSCDGYSYDVFASDPDQPHCSPTGYTSVPDHVIGSGGFKRIIGFLGGSYGEFAMEDNPYIADH